LLDRDLRYLRINDRLAAINGWPAKDHIGRTVSEILPELVPTLEPIFRRVLKSGESIRDVEINGSTPAEPGVVRYWLGSYHPLTDERGRPWAISMVVKEITDLKRRELELNQLSTFERAMSDTAAALLAAPADAVDGVIEQALAKIGKALDADLCTFLEFARDTRDLVHTHQWTSDQVDSNLSFVGVSLPEGAPTVWRDLRKLKTVRISSTDDFPAEASSERRICGEWGIKSVLWVPFESGGELLGALAINTMRHERQWSDDLVRRVDLAAEILGQAIARSRAEIEHRKSSKFETWQSCQRRS
jgi:PAS domain S-box-containing protein